MGVCPLLDPRQTHVGYHRFKLVEPLGKQKKKKKGERKSLKEISLEAFPVGKVQQPFSPHQPYPQP